MAPGSHFFLGDLGCFRKDSHIRSLAEMSRSNPLRGRPILRFRPVLLDGMPNEGWPFPLASLGIASGSLYTCVPAGGEDLFKVMTGRLIPSQSAFLRWLLSCR